MTERERLIKLLDERIAIQECSFSPDKPLTTDSLADYLLDHGIIAPPCKVGDTVYEVDIISNRVNRFVINDLYHIGRLIDDECFGTLVFLTREEAEAALAERRKA